jgi:hypothetical protein
VPLLEGLGWDRITDIAYESGPHGNEGGLDLILKCQPPIGIETKTLYELPPQHIEHPQLKTGLRKCREKEAPYFIWTNGDCWQFFSLSMADASFYQIYLSEIEDDVSLSDKFLIIKKDVFTANPERFNKAISKHLNMMALPHAWTAILQDHTKEFLQVFRKGLQHVDIRDEVILTFMKTFKSGSMLPQTKSSISFKSEDFLPQERSPIWVPKPINWEQLIDSYESPYRLARWFFRTSYYRKLGEYLISENYKPWSKDSTWRHIGLTNGTNEGKKIRHAVILFREWGFIKEAGADKYCRVDECTPYLKKLLENTKPS